MLCAMLSRCMGTSSVSQLCSVTQADTKGITRFKNHKISGMMLGVNSIIIKVCRQDNPVLQLVEQTCMVNWGSPT